MRQPFLAFWTLLEAIPANASEFDIGTEPAHFVPMIKSRIQSLPGVLLVAAIITRLRDAFKFEVPIGYQDETGFHTGVQPPKERPPWPPFW